nr:MAG TPA: hypothetical protein [Caudoviricetes sp.]
MEILLKELLRTELVIIIISLKDIHQKVDLVHFRQK